MSLVQLALKRSYTFIVMAILILLATPFALLNMATDIFPEINIPVVSVIWTYNGGCQIFCVNGVRLLLRHSFLKLNTKLI